MVKLFCARYLLQLRVPLQLPLRRLVHLHQQLLPVAILAQTPTEAKGVARLPVLPFGYG